MECWLVIDWKRVEHVGMTSKILSLMLEIDQIRVHIWVAKSEDHVNFYVYS
jgi:hypothetical protein